jgi:hypothetical protein
MNTLTIFHLTESSALGNACDILNAAAAAHDDTGRPVAVNIKLSLRFNKEAGRSEYTAAVVGNVPVGERDSKTRKIPSEFLMALNGDIEGQQTIGDGE